MEVLLATWISYVETESWKTECLITSNMSSQLQHAQQGKREGRKYIFLSQVCTARKQPSHFSSSFGVGVQAMSLPGNGGCVLHTRMKCGV